jgi:hypothetical protein
MSKKESVVAIVLSVLTIASSVLFLVYGIVIASAEDVSFWIRLFAIPTVAYGVGATAIIAWAWLGGGVIAMQSIKVSAAMFLSVYVLGSMDVGMVSGLEVLGILGVASVLWLNWFSVRYVVKWRSNA